MKSRGLLLDRRDRSIMMKHFARKEKKEKKYLPGARFPATSGTEPVWFSPCYLSSLTRTQREWESMEGWGIACSRIFAAGKGSTTFP